MLIFDEERDITHPTPDKDQGFVVLAMNIRESSEQVRTSVTRHGLSFPLLFALPLPAHGHYRRWLKRLFAEACLASPHYPARLPHASEALIQSTARNYYDENFNATWYPDWDQWRY